MKNFAGLGITFFPVDKGAQKAVDEMTESLKETVEEVEELEDVGTTAFKSLSDSISNTAKATVEKSKAMYQNFESMKSGISLSSDLESTYLSASVSAAKLSAQTGVSASKIKKNTGFFHSLNMDVDDLQKGYVRLNHAGIDASNIGFKNFKDFAKFSNVMGTSTEDLTTNLHSLRESYGFADEDLQKLIDTNAKAGRQLGVAGAVFQNMSTITANLDDHFAKLNITATPEQFNKMTNSVTLLAGAFHEAGGPINDSVNFATSLSGRLTEVQYSMKQLSSGASAELPALMENLGMSMGDFGDASQALSKDPLEFVRFMSERFGRMSGSQKEFFQSWSSENLGKDLTWLIANYGNVADKVSAAEVSMGNAAGTAQTLSKAYSDGRTASERYALAQQNFENRMFKFANTHGAVSNVLKGQAVSHRLVGDALEKQIKSGGPIGKMTELLLVYRKMGVLPAITVMAKFADEIPILGNAFKSIREMFSEGAFSPKKFGKILGNMIKDIKAQIPAMKKAALELFGGLKEGFVEAFPELSKKLGKFKDMFAGKGGLLAGAIGVGRVSMKSGPLAPYVAAVGGLAVLEKEWAGGLSGFIDDAGKAVEEYIPKIGGLLEVGFSKALKLAKKVIPVALAKYLDLMGTFWTYVGKMDWPKIGTQVGALLGDALKGLATIGKDVIVGVFNMMTGKVTEDKDSTGAKLLSGFSAMFGGMFKALGGIVLGLLEGLFDSLTEPMVGWLMENEQAFVNFQDTIFGGLTGSAEVLGGALTGVFDEFKAAGDKTLQMMSLGFRLFSTIVLDSVIGPIIKGYENMFISIFGMVQTAARAANRAGFLSNERANSILSIDPESYRISTKLGMDDASVKERRQGLAQELSSVASSGDPRGTLGVGILKMVDSIDGLRSDMRRYNSPDNKPLQVASEPGG